MGCISSKAPNTDDNVLSSPHDNENTFWKRHTRIKTLGRGASCRVDSVTRNKDNVQLAAKIISKKGERSVLNKKLYVQELEMLANFEEPHGHPNIIQFCQQKKTQCFNAHTPTEKKNDTLLPFF